MEIEEIKRVLRELNQKDDQKPEILYEICSDPSQTDKDIGDKVGYSRSTIRNRKRDMYGFLSGRGVMKFPKKSQNIIPPEVCQAMNELVRELIPEDAPPDSRPRWDLWPPVEPEPEPEPEEAEEEAIDDTVPPETPPSEEVVEEPLPQEEIQPVPPSLPPFQIHQPAPSPDLTPEPTRTHRPIIRMPFASTRLNLLVSLVAVAFIAGAIIWLTDWTPFGEGLEPEPAFITGIATETMGSTSNPATRTPNPTQTQEMQETLTAVYAAITATAFKSPTPTSPPTEIPTSTITPTATIEPTATITPTETPSPTPNLILPWEDTFENGELAPEWDVIQDTYALYNENNNWVLRASHGSFDDDYSCAQFRIGDSTLSNFYIEMNYGSRNGAEFGFANDAFEVVFGGDFRVIYDQPYARSPSFYWEEFGGGGWVDIRVESGYDFRQARHVRMEFYENDRFATLLDGSKWTEFTYPVANKVTGPILIKICSYAYMDNVRIDHLP